MRGKRPKLLAFGSMKRSGRKRSGLNDVSSVGFAVPNAYGGERNWMLPLFISCVHIRETTSIGMHHYYVSFSYTSTYCSIYHSYKLLHFLSIFL